MILKEKITGFRFCKEKCYYYNKCNTYPKYNYDCCECYLRANKKYDEIDQSYFGKEITVIIAGGRDFADYNLLKTKVSKILKNYKPDNITIVSGCARGADALGEHFAKEYGIDVKRFPAEWNKYGMSAGYRRNEQMANFSDALIAFWDGKSRGTKHMIDLARKYKLKIRVIKY